MWKAGWAWQWSLLETALWLSELFDHGRNHKRDKKAIFQLSYSNARFDCVNFYLSDEKKKIQNSKLFPNLFDFAFSGFDIKYYLPSPKSFMFLSPTICSIHRLFFYTGWTNCLFKFFLSSYQKSQLKKRNRNHKHSIWHLFHLHGSFWC